MNVQTTERVIEYIGFRRSTSPESFREEIRKKF